MTNNPKIEEDITLDVTLRPQSFNDYVGQKKIKDNLQIIIEAAQKRNEAMEHLLFHGGAGLGKTTLAYIIAKETQSRIKVTSGPTIEKVKDLASLLTNLAEGDVLFIDEIHRLNKSVEEVLYSAMEDYVLDIVIGKGPSARVLRLDLPKFTLIGATTRVSLLSSPMRSRFGATFRLDFYQMKDIRMILERSAKILKIAIDNESLELIARASRFTPRAANRLLKRARDFAQVRGNGHITANLAGQALDLLEIDKLGLESTDRHLLEVLIEKFAGGPVGINALAAATREEEDTIEDVYEPYLMQLGFLARTPKGRVATNDAYKHLGYPTPQQEPLL